MRKDILLRKDEILLWISENKSKSFLCVQLKCSTDTLEKSLKRLNIKYKGNQGSKGIPHNRCHVSQYLFYGSTITSYKLKNRLIRDNYKEKKCEECNNTEWNGKEIPLEIHHKDGDKHNNVLENLQLLCPNCHAQTKTYRGKNISSLKNGWVAELVDATDLNKN